MRAHGTQSAYTGGCRCDDCREAQREYQRGLRERSRQPCPLCDHQVASVAGLRRHLRAKHTPQDLRLYRDGMAETYRLQCVGCGADLWHYSYALERRHIIEVADLTLSHVCGGA